MNASRKVTVSVTVRFKDMAMETTDDALDIIRGVLVTTGEACRTEIEQALADAGASDVSVSMLAY
jgi:hypothetical protein